MRKFALTAMALSLASCSAALDGDGLRPAPQMSRTLPEARPPVPAPVVAVVSSPSADRSTSIMAYHNDLEACRRTASAGRGAAALDDVAALKRSLAEGAGQGVVSVSHRSDDLAVRRDRAVKDCLSKRGYVLKD